VIRKFRFENKKWAKVTVEKFRATITSLREARKRRIDLPLFFLSFLIRLGKYVSIYFLLFALLRSHGYSLSTFSFWKLILGITGAELTSILPVKGLAGFGTWESAWALTFSLMSFDQNLAIISGIGVHLITNLLEYSLGIGSLLILALPFFKHKNQAACEAAHFLPK
jgi:hypothetical protein